MSEKNPPVNALTPKQTIRKDEKAPSFLIPMFKLPLLLYRLRLGRLMGYRFMQLTHVGRRSGKVYRTVLAVLRFDKETQEVYAVSAWKGSDWYYNIQAAPALQLETGSVRYAPAQGKFKGLLDQVLPLSEAVRAHEIVGGRDGLGKVILEPTRLS